MTSNDWLLRTVKLQKYFPIRSHSLMRRLRWLKAVDDVSLAIRRGDSFGIVGESGCGKSTLGKTIMGIHRPTAGQVWLEKRRIDNLPHRQIKRVRKRVQYVYQDPGASLDPWWSVGKSLAEPLRVHERLTTADMKAQVRSIVREVGLEETHLYRYPHEFSGGQQRRIGLARILVMRPTLIIFDEPTSGLDVSVQATILQFFRQIKDAYNLTYIFISHDLDVIRLMTDRISVMYLGQIVETGITEAVLRAPMHPYTQLLLAALPRIEQDAGSARGERVITGELLDPQNLPRGCRFRSRCPLATEVCEEQSPELRQFSPGWSVACHMVDPIA